MKKKSEKKNESIMARGHVSCGWSSASGSFCGAGSGMPVATSHIFVKMYRLQHAGYGIHDERLVRMMLATQPFTRNITLLFVSRQTAIGKVLLRLGGAEAREAARVFAPLPMSC